MKKLFAATLIATAASLAHAGSLFEQGRQAILRQSGCFVVDYSFVETESLKEGYSRDSRVYDSNADKTTVELIVPIQKSPTEIRLQHVLFLRDLKTGEVKGLMKHHAEDWEFEASHRYDFVSAGNWQAVPGQGQGRWVRKVTNLDDGLRYQCEAAWNFDTFNPEWSCANFSPIPGRETRDMGRKDYNSLDRKTRVIVYPDSWVERQDNVKTLLSNGEKEPLAREHGRTWYVRQPDAICAEAREWAETRKPYWEVLSQVWEEYFAEGRDWSEKGAVNGMPRFAAMFAVESEFADRLIAEPSLKDTVKAKIREVIEAYRVK